MEVAALVRLREIEAKGNYPFVFDRTRYRSIARLVYSRNVRAFVRVAGALGRLPLKRGYPFIVFDADAPVTGLAGKFLQGTPRYQKGPGSIASCDMAFSEVVMFGR
jgi:hypothetical protein